MLRVSRLADYATGMMVVMARSHEKIYSAKELAEETFLGLPTVSKVLKLLSQAGLLISHRGVQGGYALSRLPNAILLVDVIDAVEGGMGMTDCSHDGHCEMESVCHMRGNWQYINNVVYQALADITLDKLAHNAQAANASGEIKIIFPENRRKRKQRS